MEEDGWEAGLATWDWSKLDLRNLWEVLPPDWAVEREMRELWEGVFLPGE